MMRLQLDDLAPYADTLQSRRGDAITIRFVTPGDAEALQAYVRSLNSQSRYNRFLGAMSELPNNVLNDFLHVGEHDRFSVVATMLVDGFETIVGEARYGFNAETESVEFGLSVHDRWQGLGIGAALLKNLECRAASLGAGSVFGDTLRSNAAMLGLARQAGYSFIRHPDDWRLVRFEKPIAQLAPVVACASWRLAAASRQAAMAAAAN